MKKIDLPMGTFTLRDSYDEAVLKEVYLDDEYRRWGDIGINRGSIVVDCGAHIGVFSKLASSCGAYLYSIEPHKGNFDLLKINMAHRNAKLLNMAIGDGNPVSFLVDPTRNELHKVDPAGLETIPSISLDQLVEKYDLFGIDLLKMDIEGAEYEALYNFKAIDRVRQLTMEWHYGASRMSELIIYLEKKGLKTVWLGGNGDWGKLQMKKI